MRLLPPLIPTLGSKTWRMSAVSQSRERRLSDRSARNWIAMGKFKALSSSTKDSFSFSLFSFFFFFPRRTCLVEATNGNWQLVCLFLIVRRANGRPNLDEVC